MTRPTLTGIMPLRNAARLGYPFVIAIRSLQRVCDDVVVNVDPTSDDSTIADVMALCADPVNGTPTRILESVWDMGNHDGHRNCEISVQTQKLCDAATGDWILSLQADEVIRAQDCAGVRLSIAAAEVTGHTAVAGRRLYFYERFDAIREDWTFPLRRLVKRGHWRPDVDGAMNFDPVRYVPIDNATARAMLPDVPSEMMECPTYLDHPGLWFESEEWGIFHYSRVGDPAAIARRVRNLDTFFHAPADVLPESAVAPYDFSELRKLDTYRIGATIEPDPSARLVPFDIRRHPAEILEFYGVTP